MSAGGEPLTLFVPWPRLPTLTPTGKVSLAKTAGKPVPWLSANVVSGMHHRKHKEIVACWREMAAQALRQHFLAGGTAWTGNYPVMLDFLLQKRTAANMDPYAVLEGAKNCIDGLIDRIVDGIKLPGLFPDDNDNYVRGGTALARKGDPLGLYVRVTEWHE